MPCASIHCPWPCTRRSYDLRHKTSLGGHLLCQNNFQVSTLQPVMKHNGKLGPSRAVIPAREWAKRRQGRMWVGLLSAEKFVVQSAEAFSIAEGNTACTALVRCGRALRRPRTHARMYVRGWDLRGLSAAQRQGRGRQSEGSSRSMDERRREVRCGSISCEADEQSVDDHMAELVERRTAPKGKPQIPARSGHRAGLCVSQGMDRLRLGVEKLPYLGSVECRGMGLWNCGIRIRRLVCLLLRCTLVGLFPAHG